MPFDTHTRGVQRHVVFDGIPDPKRRDSGVEPPVKTCKCLFMIYQVAAPISNSAFYRTISDLFSPVIIIICTLHKAIPAEVKMHSPTHAYTNSYTHTQRYTRRYWKKQEMWANAHETRDNISL